MPFGKETYMGSLSNNARVNVSAWMGILHHLCPRCRTGRIFGTSIFRIFPRMHERCPVCGLKFEREQGYFLGAMYFSYTIGILAITLFAFIAWALLGWDLPQSVAAGFLLFLPAAPVVTFFSRVLWIYFDQSIDPDWS
jgi:uncharacterized protein (DUF983 family)